MEEEVNRKTTSGKVAVLGTNAPAKCEGTKLPYYYTSIHVGEKTPTVCYCSAEGESGTIYL